MSSANNKAANKEDILVWYRDQIDKYVQVYPRYKLFALTLQKVLEKTAKSLAPEAVVQTRPKAVSSFAEKIIRKSAFGNDSVNEFTDLCGARVVTHIPAEVRAVSEFIEKHFEIDWENSVDASQRLRTAEFGYRSIHYIVSFKSGIFPTEDIVIQIPEDVSGLKAEIQVRTVFEHAWADFSHNTSYKGAFNIPQKWERELARIAATLEDLDSDFSRVNEGLQRYAASYGTYMTRERMRDEIDKLEIVLEYDPENLKVAHRIGKLAITLGEWQKAIDVLSRYISSDHQPVLRDLGIAICKHHKNDPQSLEYLKGQEYLERACSMYDKDSDALASLAGTYKGVNDDKARDLYRQAFEIDPTDPYALGNYLEYEIVSRRDISLVSLISPVINKGIQKCKEQEEVGMNIPWTYYDMGKFYLFLKMPYESLAAHAKAIQLSTDDWMIETSIRSHEKLAVVQESLPGYEWVRRFLIAGRAARFQKEDALQDVKKLTSADHAPFKGQCVIVVGGNDINKQHLRSFYEEDAFRDFKGTVISIGTKESDTSAQEAVQVWVDLIVSGIQLSEVKVLGFGGNSIAGAEYRIALALGARVGIVKSSGNEAARLLSDNDWNTSEMLVHLPDDMMTIRAFIGSGIPELEHDTRETIARAIHEAYRDIQINKKQNNDPSLAKWDNLLEYLKESNRMQANHIAEKLQKIGCTVVKVEGRNISLIKFTDTEIEVMSEMEHARWNVERLLDGWKFGREKDVIKKISPYLIPWSELTDEVKEWDRETVRKIPEFLAKVGMEVQRKV